MTGIYFKRAGVPARGMSVGISALEMTLPPIHVPVSPILSMPSPYCQPHIIDTLKGMKIYKNLIGCPSGMCKLIQNSCHFFSFNHASTPQHHWTPESSIAMVANLRGGFAPDARHGFPEVRTLDMYVRDLFSDTPLFGSCSPIYITVQGMMQQLQSSPYEEVSTKSRFLRL